MLFCANTARASGTPRSTIAANCSSCPGRASCAVSDHAAAGAVKSSARAADFAFGLVMTRVTPQQSQEVQRVSEQLLRNVNGYVPAIILALAAGIGEEVLFRGALLPRVGNVVEIDPFQKCREAFRVGIGRPPANGVDYVLSPFTAAEQAQLTDIVSRVADAVLLTIEQGLERAMTEFNRV